MNFLYKIIAVPLGYLMKGCYWVVNAINLPLPYVCTLFLFTLAKKIILFPLMMKQQKSQARMSAFTPMINDIRTRYKNNPEKQNEELTRLSTEYGYNPTSGCLPMILNLVIMLGLVEVIYRPLTYMLTCPSELITQLTSKTAELYLAEVGKELSANDRMVETYIIQYVKTNFAAFKDIFANYQTELTAIENLKMTIGSVALYEKPVLGFNWGVLIPVFSVVTQLASVFVSMKASGSMEGDAAAQTKSMMITTSLMFAVFSFMYPMGFSLYWGFQNLLSMIQSIILKKMYDPSKIKEEIQAEIKKKKKEKNARKTVSYTDKATGEVVTKEVSASESDRIRLQRAREIDFDRYGE